MSDPFPLVSIQAQGGVRMLNPFPVDYWSGPFTGSTIAEALTAANALISPGIRFRSMEVRLVVGSDTYKYWYYGGTADSDLIEFISTVVGPTGNTGNDGPVGATGSTGYGFTAAFVSGDGELYISTLLPDGSSINERSIGLVRGSDGINGERGETGATGTFTGDFVSTLNSLTGDITIVAGTNVGVDVDGSTITISASGGSAETTWGRTDPTTTTVGGVAAGTTFDVSANAVEVLHRMLYPYQSAAFTSFSVGIGIPSTPQIVDLGTTSVSGTYASSWTYTQPSNWLPGTVSISRTSPDSASLATGLSITSTPTSISHPTYRYTTPTELTFRITGSQQQGSDPNRTTNTHNWRARIFYGKSAEAMLAGSYSSYSEFTSLFAGGISSLFTPSNTGLATPSGTTITFNPPTDPGQYLWLFSPNMLSSFRVYNNFIETNAPGFQTPPSMTGDIVLTNINGVSSNYVFYRWAFPTVDTPTFRINVV